MSDKVTGKGKGKGKGKKAKTTVTGKSNKISDYTKLPGSVDDESGRFKFNTLEYPDNKGNTRIWTCEVAVYFKGKEIKIIDDNIPKEDDNGWIVADREIKCDKAEIIKYSGRKDGKITEQKPVTILSGKGKAGSKAETTIFTQALKQAYGYYKTQEKKMDEGFRPMKPEDIKRLSATALKKYKFEGIVQVKVNGVGGVVIYKNNKAAVYSRTAELLPEYPILVPELNTLYEELSKYKLSDVIKDEENDESSKDKNEEDDKSNLFDYDFTLDQLYLNGELMTKDKHRQDTIGAIKSYKTPSSDVQYYIFDVIHPDHLDMVFKYRFQLLNFIINTVKDLKLEWIKDIESHEVKNREEVDKWHTIFDERGEEGAVFKGWNMPYELSNRGKRSKNALKFTTYITEEFTIVDYTKETTGANDGALMFICLDEESGKTFTVQPLGKIEDRKILYDQMSEYTDSCEDEFEETEENEDDEDKKTLFERCYLNKPYTVKYKQRSKDGIPLEPKGIALRVGINA